MELRVVAEVTELDRECVVVVKVSESDGATSQELSMERMDGGGRRRWSSQPRQLGLGLAGSSLAGSGVKVYSASGSPSVARLGGRVNRGRATTGRPRCSRGMDLSCGISSRSTSST